MSRDQLGQFVARHVVQIVVTAIGLGMAWASLTAMVAQKADKSTVEAMARDVKTIRAVVCADHGKDSYCRQP